MRVAVQGRAGLALNRAVDKVERMTAFDGVAEPISGAVQQLTQSDEVKNALSGAALGHVLHPVLTDLPIGFWTSAALLEVVGGDDGAIDALLAAGNVSALAAAATGLADWSDAFGAPKRIGLVHAALNVGALGVLSAALLARRAGARRAGRRLSALGYATATVSAYLGGHLVYRRGLGVTHSGFDVEETVNEWQDVAADSDIVDGTPRRVTANDVAIMLVRQNGDVRALVASCNHAGGPLDEGEVADGAVTCPWHGSRFSLDDGCVLRGPASLPQPVLETRVRDGRVEVRFP